MPSYTPNLGLVKPMDTETVSIEVLNANWDTLDEVVSGLQYTDELITTVETVGNKEVRWFVRRYLDGRMEIESDPVQYTIPIRYPWKDTPYGWFISTSSFQWVFPYSFVSLNTYDVRAVETSELVTEVPVLNTPGTWVSVLTMSGWLTYLFYAAPDSKSSEIKIRCRVTGMWK